jgi:ketosteroid isomerase-like protein
LIELDARRDKLSSGRIAATGETSWERATSVEALNKALVRDSFKAWAQGTGGPFDLVTDGDIVVIFFDGKATARHGKPYASTYFWLFEMHDGKVTRASVMFDSVELNDFWTRVSPAGA